jgi:hypothetical protein
VASQLEALEVQRNLRFGNHIHALANAYLVAKALGLPKVIIPSHPLLREEFSIHGVYFSQKGEESEGSQSAVRLRGTFFYRHTLGHLRLEDKRPTVTIFPFFTDALRVIPRFRRGELQEWVSMRIVEQVKKARRDLTIHIRSGDIFSSDHPHPGYWQPPLSFYLQSIDQVKPRQVTLVFEDRGNPVIDKIEEHLIHTGISYQVKDGPIEEAIWEIVTAKNLVVAKGTFSRPMVALSRSLKNLWIYAAPQSYDVLSRLVTTKFKLHIVPDAERAYEAKVSAWRNSEDQREAMLAH